MIKEQYYLVHKKNLNIYGVGFENLKEFCTTKKDAEKKLYKMPNNKSIIQAENLYGEAAGEVAAGADFGAYDNSGPKTGGPL